MDTRLARYLLTYRVTPHSTTGVAPSELLMNRKLRTVFDAVLPDLNSKVKIRQQYMKEYYDRSAATRSVDIGDAVFVKNHTGSGPKWIPSTLRDRNGDVTVAETNDGRMIRRHLDHVRRRHNVNPQPIVKEMFPETEQVPEIVNQPTSVIPTTLPPSKVVEPTVFKTPVIRRSTRTRAPVKRLDL